MRLCLHLLWHRRPVRSSDCRAKQQAIPMPACGTHTHVVSDALPHVPTHHTHKHKHVPPACDTFKVLRTQRAGV